VPQEREGRNRKGGAGGKTEAFWSYLIVKGGGKTLGGKGEVRDKITRLNADGFGEKV